MSDCCAPKPAPDVGSAAGLPEFTVRPGVMFPDWSVVASPVVRSALLAMIGSDHILHGWSGYSAAVDRVRAALIQFYADNGRAPTLLALAAEVGLTEMALHPLLDDLSERDLAVLEGGLIVGAYPFASQDTGHQIRLDGNSVNAMCAVDALGVGAMLDRDVEIISRCWHCGSPIKVSTRDRGRTLDEVSPRSAVVWLSVRYEGGCAANSLCSMTAFFCSDNHLAAWRSKRPADEPGFRLSIEEALEAGRAIFGPSLTGLRSQGDAVSSAAKSGASKLTTFGRRTPKSNVYDLAVIGAGSAGFSAAIAAADQGAQVALIGSGIIGGTCVNVGCVPSKTLIRAAETLHNARAAARFAGVAADAEVADWRATVRQKDDLVGHLRQTKYADLLPAYNGIAYREGSARLVLGGVDVGGTRIAADRVIIATGARPTIPSIPGIEAVPCLTSTSALELHDLPRTLLVVGGGYIGAELAQLFARAGVKMTLVFRSRLLPEAEPEISRALTGYFEDEGINIVSAVAYRSIHTTEAGVALSVERDGQIVTLDAEQVLVTTGRTPNTEALDLTGNGVAITANGGIAVDDRMRTTRPGIYAGGDVTGHDQFVYMAAYGAKLAAKNALNGDSLRYDNAAMPAVVFCDPQVASVGLTEAAARAAGHHVRVSTIALDQVPRALAARDTRGLIKLVAEGATGRLLGAHILAPEGADSIQTAALAITCRLTVRQLADTIFPYLTTVEGLKLAALSFDKDVARLSCCAG